MLKCELRYIITYDTSIFTGQFRNSSKVPKGTYSKDASNLFLLTESYPLTSVITAAYQALLLFINFIPTGIVFKIRNFTYLPNFCHTLLKQVGT